MADVVDPVAALLLLLVDGGLGLDELGAAQLPAHQLLHKGDLSHPVLAEVPA